MVWRVDSAEALTRAHYDAALAIEMLLRAKESATDPDVQAALDWTLRVILTKAEVEATTFHVEQMDTSERWCRACASFELKDRVEACQGETRSGKRICPATRLHFHRECNRCKRVFMEATGLDPLSYSGAEWK